MRPDQRPIEPAEESEQILTSFRSRRWEPEHDGRPWLAAVLVVAVSLAVWYFWLRPPDRVPEPVEQPIPVATQDPVGAPVTLPTMRPDRSAPVAPRARATGDVQIYECIQDGQRVLSDRPCGPGAVERFVDTRELNTFTEVPPPPVTAPRRPPSTSSRAPVGSISRPSAADAHQARCEQIEAWKDRIDAAMRQGYTSQEGERLRAQWHRAKQAYYDEGCGR